jgi:hypothetical protein
MAVRMAGVGLHERLEDALEVLGRDARAGIADIDREADLAILLVRADRDAHAAPFRELDRVADDVQEHLAHAHGIGPDGHARGGIRHDMVERDPERRRAKRKQPHHLVHEVGDDHVGRNDGELPRIDARDVEDVADHREQVVTVAADGLEVRGTLARREAFVPEQVGVAEDRGHRGANLVRDARDEERLRRACRLGGTTQLALRAFALLELTDAALELGDPRTDVGGDWFRVGGHGVRSTRIPRDCTGIAGLGKGYPGLHPWDDATDVDVGRHPR